MKTMELAELLTILPRKQVQGSASARISGVCYDSRRVKPGDLFVCVRGFKHDGHDFARDAVDGGATALVVERPVTGLGVPQVIVEDSRQALALVSSAFYGHPSKDLRIVGVTGTNGKTTTAHFVREILKAAGKKADLLGTVWNIIGDRVMPVERTTPESSDLQALFASMLEAGTEYAVMEVSSHALSLKRVFATEFDIGVFTNLTQDHLDFHRTLDDYLSAKSSLFWGLGVTYWGEPKRGKKFAVLNADDPATEFILSKVRVDYLTYGVAESLKEKRKGGVPPGAGSGAPDLHAEDVQVEQRGVSFKICWPGGATGMRMRVTGKFNVYNALAAAAVGLGEGFPMDCVVQALQQANAMPGRFESIDEGQDFGVIVDYAHTPDGLANVLRTARELTRSRVIVVFGCGGDRDKAKRPVMGRIAAELGDVVIITSDNPRSEEPSDIARDILAGISLEERSTRKAEVVLDRRQAIEAAVKMARPGDIVLIAGKGHETYQIFKDRVVSFDDRLVAREALRKCARCSA